MNPCEIVSVLLQVSVALTGISLLLALCSTVFFTLDGLVVKEFNTKAFALTTLLLGIFTISYIIAHVSDNTYASFCGKITEKTAEVSSNQ